MAASVACAASRQEISCNCEEMLRKQRLREQKAGLSAQRKSVPNAANVSFPPSMSMAQHILLARRLSQCGWTGQSLRRCVTASGRWNARTVLLATCLRCALTKCHLKMRIRTSLKSRSANPLISYCGIPSLSQFHLPPIFRPMPCALT